ncbi:MAG TPA: DUF58 domain-containing protein [Roseiflexaceae bacterium]|nr:DUF58 domain-containing protein [Roseiflexaceae bacterium]
MQWLRGVYAQLILLFIRWRAGLTLDGRLQLVQPWALLPGPLLLLIALLAPYRWLFFIAYTYLLFVLAAYLWLRFLGPRIELDRQIATTWAQVGDVIEEEWRLRSESRLPLLWLEIDDRSTLPGYATRRVMAASGGEEHWRTQALCVRRGVFQLGPLWARTSDPAGIFSYAWRQGGAGEGGVYPPLVRLPDARSPRGQRGDRVRADLLQQQLTPVIGGIREYRPGDPPGRIHWPTVARRQQLMVKEFDQEQAGALWIVLDLARDSYPADKSHATTQHPGITVYGQSSRVIEQAPKQWDSALELAIVLAGSLAAQALADGRTVGLLADDGRRRVVTPAGGSQQLWRILEALVDAQATGTLPLGELLRQGRVAYFAAMRGVVAVVTPALDGAWLPQILPRGQGSQGGALAHLIATQAQQAAPLTERLAAIGVASRIFVVGTALPLLNPPRPRAALRVSPLGRIMGVV